MKKKAEKKSGHEGRKIRRDLTENTEQIRAFFQEQFEKLRPEVE